MKLKKIKFKNIIVNFTILQKKVTHKYNTYVHSIT